MSPEEQSELAIGCGGIDAYNYVHHFLENDGFIFETAQLAAYTSAVEAKERERCANKCVERHANGNYKCDDRHDCQAAIRSL